jgi:hypothetical protein
MTDTFFVSLDMRSAMDVIDRAMSRGGATFSGARIGSFGAAAPGGGGFVVRVYEKRYKNMSHLRTVTAVLDDLTGRTRVHGVNAGGGGPLFTFGWGPAARFERMVTDALAPWRI